jgi:hypothetical protein
MTVDWREDSLNHREAKTFLAGLVQRSRMTWSEIHRADRSRAGYEPIPTSALNVRNVPSVLPDERVLVFRELGLFRFAGFRSGHTFYILYIDPRGKLYRH